MTVVEIAAFHVADKPQTMLRRHFAQQRQSLTGERIAFGLLFSDGEQAQPRIGHMKYVFCVHKAHYREFKQVICVTVHICAYIQQHAGCTDGRRQHRGERRAIYAGKRAEHHLGRSHRRPGIACRDEAPCKALADHFQADAHGGIFLGANRLSGLVLHRDPLAGLLDVNRELFWFAAREGKPVLALGDLQGFA